MASIYKDIYLILFVIVLLLLISTIFYRQKQYKDNEYFITDISDKLCNCENGENYDGSELQSNLIPKHIYQTSKSTKLTKSMGKAVESWTKLNPDYKYTFYNDEKAREFIEKNFTSRVLSAYDKIIPGAYKADLFRYCLLYKYGGIYVDIKSVCLESLNKYIEGVSFIAPIDTPWKGHYLYNGFIASCAYHPFLKKAIEMVVSNVETRNYCKNMLDVTGPGLLGRSVNLCLGLDQENNYDEGYYDLSKINFEKQNNSDILSEMIEPANGQHYNPVVEKMLLISHKDKHLSYKGSKIIKRFYDRYYKENRSIYNQSHYGMLYYMRNIFK